MNFKKTLICVLMSLFSLSIYPKIVEYVEDAYLAQAPQELVERVEQVADLMQFKNAYEVMVPKKPALEINPWNKFVSHGINPVTKNPMIIINQEWFSSMPDEQQAFLLGRAFENFIQGTIPSSMNFVMYLFLLLRILFIVAVFLILGKTRLNVYGTWVKLLLAIVVNVITNLLFVNQLEGSIKQHLARKHDLAINEMVIQKTLDREAGIKALEYFDASIKKELSKGELFWAPHSHLFEKYAQELKKNI